jgi:predicted MFS family arabinose efflux permease
MPSKLSATYYGLTRECSSVLQAPSKGFTEAIATPAAGSTPETCVSAAVRSFRYPPLYWLALGAFAVGTEGFMIAAILPRIAANLSVSLQAVGQLVIVFTLTYAVSSPLLTALTGGADRRKLLVLSMASFALANFVAAAAPSYWFLVMARVLIAISAGLYVPNANALAGALVTSEGRGRAWPSSTVGSALP